MNTSAPPPKVSFVRRLLGRLYPFKNIGMPALPNGIKMSDGIMIGCDLNISMGERLRLLFCSGIHVTVLVACEKKPGSVVSNIMVNSIPPFPQKEEPAAVQLELPGYAG